MIYQCQCDRNANDGAGGAIPDSLWAVEYSLSLPSELGNLMSVFKLPNYSSNKTPEEAAALQACGD